MAPPKTSVASYLAAEARGLGLRSGRHSSTSWPLAASTGVKTPGPASGS
jgi:hypothetical protein